MTLVETPSRIEPTLLDETNAEILDLVAELSRASGALGSRLHPRAAANLADLVRVMNCYSSNLIEGHNTTPRDLLAALVEDGVLGSDTPKGPVSLRFPLHAVEVLFPSLFPES